MKIISEELCDDLVKLAEKYNLPILVPNIEGEDREVTKVSFEIVEELEEEGIHLIFE